MEHNKPNTFQTVSSLIVAGSASLTLVMGWLNQVFALLIASSGTEGSGYFRYFNNSFYLTLGGLAIFAIGLILILSHTAPEKRKAVILMLLATVLFITGMSIMFITPDFGNGLKEGAKDAYLIIALRAGLMFIGFGLFYKAVGKYKFECNKFWIIASKIVLVILMLVSLLMFIPVVGDIIFAITFMFCGILQAVCFYPMLSK